MGKGGNAGGFKTNVKSFTGSFRNDIFGTSDEAAAAQAAAQEQQTEARSQRNEAVGYAKQGVDLAGATPQELQAYGHSLDAADRQLQQQQKLIDSIDPSIMEASKQILGILQGQTSGVGNALGNQRAQQRTSLVNSLRQNLGAGAETTAAGMKALQQFDSESAGLGAQTQNQSLGTLLGVVNGRPTMSGALGDLNQAGMNFSNIQNRVMGARGMTLNAMLGTGAPLLQTAGADQTANMIKSGAQRQFWDNWSNSSMKFGEMFGGMGAGSAGGGGGGKKGGGGMANSFNGTNGNYSSGNDYSPNNFNTDSIA